MTTFRKRVLDGDVADLGNLEKLDAKLFESTMIDRRTEHSPIIRNPGQQAHVYSPPHRLWTQTRGITLHQTACDMGERIARYDTLGAHFAVLRSGRILRMCDNDRIVYHGNGWNNQCVGIEINGLYAGLEDDPDTATDEALKTTWDDPTTAIRETPMAVTEAAMLATRQLIRWIVWDVHNHGGNLEVLCAHRQSSANRREDPGEAIWKDVGLPMQWELGLNDGGAGFKLGDGYPIPTEWNPDYPGFPY